MLSCIQLCNAADYSQPGSSVPRIQVRTLEWAAIFFFRGSFQARDWTAISCVSCTGRQILYHSATWEAPCRVNTYYILGIVLDPENRALNKMKTLLLWSLYPSRRIEPTNKQDIVFKMVTIMIWKKKKRKKDMAESFLPYVRFQTRIMFEQIPKENEGVSNFKGKNK